MNDHFCCPECGNKNLQIINETHTQTHGSNFSASKGCLGYLILGPLGILCGACGQNQTTTTTNTKYWYCPNCGNRFKDLNSYETEIQSLYSTANASLPVLGTIGGILAVIFFVVFVEHNGGIASFLSIFTEAIFLLVGFLGRLMNKSVAENKEKELNTLRRKMQRHCDKVQNPPIDEKPTNILQTPPPSGIAPVDISHDYNIPVKVTVNKYGKIFCPNCGTEQNGDRYKCFNCEATFVNGQPNIPHWCAQCGLPGPYTEVCPKCGSTEKIINQ